MRRRFDRRCRHRRPWNIAARGYNSSTGYYELSWDTTSVANGSHTIDAPRTDSSGNNTDASRVIVTISNAAATATMHVASVDVRTAPFLGGWQKVLAQVVIVDSDGGYPCRGLW